MTPHWRTWLEQSYGWFRKQDLLALLLLLIAVLSVWAFVELADEIMEGETHAVDAQILRSLRNPADLSDPLGPVWIEEAFRDLTALGSVVVLLLVTGAVKRATRRKERGIYAASRWLTLWCSITARSCVS